MTVYHLALESMRFNSTKTYGNTRRTKMVRYNAVTARIIDWICHD